MTATLVSQFILVFLIIIMARLIMPGTPCEREENSPFRYFFLTLVVCLVILVPYHELKHLWAGDIATLFDRLGLAGTQALAAATGNLVGYFVDRRRRASARVDV